MSGLQQGFLEQRRRDGRWNSLFCRLHDFQLSFYSGLLDDKALASFALRDYHVTVGNEGKKAKEVPEERPFIFRLDKPGVSEHILAAPDLLQFEKWIKAFSDRRIEVNDFRETIIQDIEDVEPTSTNSMPQSDTSSTESFTRDDNSPVSPQNTSQHSLTTADKESLANISSIIEFARINPGEISQEGPLITLSNEDEVSSFDEDCLRSTQESTDTNHFQDRLDGPALSVGLLIDNILESDDSPEPLANLLPPYYEENISDQGTHENQSKMALDGVCINDQNISAEREKQAMLASNGNALQNVMYSDSFGIHQELESERSDHGYHSNGDIVQNLQVERKNSDEIFPITTKSSGEFIYPVNETVHVPFLENGTNPLESLRSERLGSDLDEELGSCHQAMRSAKRIFSQLETRQVIKSPLQERSQAQRVSKSAATSQTKAEPERHPDTSGKNDPSNVVIGSSSSEGPRASGESQVPSNESPTRQPGSVTGVEEQELVACEASARAARSLFLQMEAQPKKRDNGPQQKRPQLKADSEERYFVPSSGKRIPLSHSSSSVGCDNKEALTETAILCWTGRYDGQSQERTLLRSLSNPFLAHRRLRQREAREGMLMAEEQRLRQGVELLRAQSLVDQQNTSYTLIRSGPFVHAVALKSQALPQSLAEAETKLRDAQKRLQENRAAAARLARELTHHQGLVA